ncbi:hypothetical protein K2F40_00605 [Clostridium sp. CM028]|uniref:hypothetical protein n=1 Tax=unclassified Clostridium TaxID=2614128 RepID=UPI001C0E1133|nr:MULTISPECIES: hypothetical protein [unclassified Clostridium]MBU3091542.1 hypothetical protein [Clostridium sp. CF011]MBW9144194.1 hypothetical protein [Clostridium sp. CM027]MBW9147496.1 hypothetical protein [Clostridium sp. CM028]UVE41166.1 hypothetical protein KTC92_01275 [Clostridium sp. CM027]WAG70162.1 hypothetical protein LL036_01540 [Clostridium sp. CF011]
MVKRTFIPNWYIDKKDKIRNKKIKVCIIVTLIANIFLLFLILNISNKIKIIEQEQVKENKNNISVVEAAETDIITREKYKELSDFFGENKFSYKNIIITKAGLEIDIEVKSYEEYVNVIRYIENKYSIKNLTPNNKEEGTFNFKVILEV